MNAKALQTRYVRADGGPYTETAVTIVPVADDTVAVYEGLGSEARTPYFDGPAPLGHKFAQDRHDALIRAGYVVLRTVS